MSEKSIIQKEVEEFLSQKILKPIMESLDEHQINLLSNALSEAFSHLVNKYSTFKPLTLESVNSVIEALNIVMINMNEKDLKSVLSDLIEELKNFIENNDKRIYVMQLELNEQNNKLNEQNNKLNEQNNQLNEQKNIINRLARKVDKTEALFLANDLSDIYINYIFEPKYSHIKGKPQTWSNFTNRISRIEQKLRHQQLKHTVEHTPSINDDDKGETQIVEFYDSIKNEFKVNIRDLRALKRERAASAHYPRRTAEEQKQLIDKARHTDIPSDFEYKKVFNDMLEELDEFHGKFHRIAS